MSACAQPLRPAAFDSLAESYDRIFTRSLIGRAQRDAVWRQLRATFLPGQRVLELNCGTGVDAMYLAQMGVQVDAFDISAAMIQVASRHLRPEHCPAVRFQVLASEDLGRLNSTYDGVFSNFGGLNCVEDLREVAQNQARLVRPLGHALLCLANHCCFWETGWWLAHGKPGKAFRRLKRNGVTAELMPGSQVRVWYPSVGKLKQVFAPEFRLISAHGVGVFVPPSYLEPCARRLPMLLRVAAGLDARLSSFPLLRGMGDHVLVKLRRMP